MEPMYIYYDFVMGILVSSLCIVFLYYFRKKLFHTGALSIKGLVFLYGICVFRAIFHFEFPFGASIRFNVLMPLTDLLFFMPISIGGSTYLGYQIAGFVYLIIMLFYLNRLVYSYIKAGMVLKKAEAVNDPIVSDTLLKLSKDYGKSRNLKVLKLEGLSGPISTGIINKRVVLPGNYSKLYSESDLYNLISHEYNHVLGHDSIIMFMTNIASCIMFWNPCMKLLKKDLEQSLELRCDSKVIQKMTLESKASYLETMLSVLKTANSSHDNDKAYCPEPVLNFVANKPIYLEERFQVIANKAQKTDIFKAATLYITIIAMVFCSYTFILMAHYDPPIEDIIEGPDCYEIDFEKDYFSINCDGTYSMHLKDGTVLEADLEDYEWWIENKGKIVQE